MQEERAAALRDRVQQLLAPFTGTERALDSGCGAGALAFALAPFVGSVVGVDLSANLIYAGDHQDRCVPLLDPRQPAGNGRGARAR